MTNFVIVQAKNKTMLVDNHCTNTVRLRNLHSMIRIHLKMKLILNILSVYLPNFPCLYILYIE